MTSLRAPESKHVLWIACPDRQGLIHEISGVLFRAGANITENREYVDHRAKRFYMRTEFAVQTASAQLLESIKAVVGADGSVTLQPTDPKRIVVMVSRELHCLGELLLRSSLGELNAEIQAVVSQVEHGRELAERFEIPFHCVPVSGQTREQHEAAILKAVAPYRPEFLILARYMRIFTSGFIAHFPDRIINIHHSFLPAFIGHDPYEQAHARGVKMIGATSHFVTQDLDEGPIISQQVIQIDHSHDPQEMAIRGRDAERLVLAEAVKLVLQNRVFLDGKRTIIFT